MNNLFLAIVMETGSMLAMAGPYILFGFIMAGLIHTFISPARIVTLLGKRNWKSVLMASICGVPLPLCSCSVLPTAAALREKGASRGATTSFLISTPETGVDSISMTYGIMDLTMAVLRPLAAFVTALVAGLLVNIWGESEEAPQEIPKTPKEAVPGSSCCCAKKETPAMESCPSASQSKRSWWKESIQYAFGDLSNNLSHWLALGLVLSGIISVCIPETFFQSWAGQGFSSLILMLAISMPMYICASGSTPIAAAMLAKGLSPGAALVFLLAGPATNMGAIPVLLKILGRRSTLLYLGTIAGLSLLIGYGVNLYFTPWQIVPKMAIHTHDEPMGGILGVLSALVLLFLLIKGMWRRSVPQEWQNLNTRLASLTGFQLSWGKFLTLLFVLAVLSFVWPWL